VVWGFGAQQSAYMFVHFDDGPALMGELAGRVATAKFLPEQSAIVNVALSGAGLLELGVCRDEFPGELMDGMRVRAEMLGDTGPSRPEKWDPGFAAAGTHAVVTVSGKDDQAFKQLAAETRTLLGPQLVGEQAASMLGGNREHFGFADGLSQPSIEGLGPDTPGQGVPTKKGWRPLKAGEFVLGYEDEDGVRPPAPEYPLDRNATYMVLRKLYQDVAGFRRFLFDHEGADEAKQSELASKIVGRRHDGTSLLLDPEAPEQNDFRFGGDPEGMRCPLGAHVRRSNPRDALGFGARLSSRHRIIRRGMPYGEPLPGGETVDDGADRGLIFVCFCASIERQYEVVQTQWCNDGDAFGLGREPDLLLGGDGSARMTLPGNPPRFVRRKKPFVLTRGGEYLYVPSLSGLRALAGT